MWIRTAEKLINLDKCDEIIIEWSGAKMQSLALSIVRGAKVIPVVTIDASKDMEAALESLNGIARSILSAMQNGDATYSVSQDTIRPSR